MTEFLDRRDDSITERAQSGEILDPTAERLREPVVEIPDLTPEEEAELATKVQSGELGGKKAYYTKKEEEASNPYDEVQPDVNPDGTPIKTIKPDIDGNRNDIMSDGKRRSA